MPEIQIPQDKELQKLLNPVSESSPCGEDLWFAEGNYKLQQPLEEMLKGGNSEEPKWNSVRDDAIELMARSHDLRIAVLLCLAQFRIAGLPGFRDGLILIHGLMEKYWDQLHPLPDGENDPSRGNTLSNLSAPAGSGPYRFIKHLRDAPLCQSPGGGAYSLADIDRAESGKVPDDPTAKPPATQEQINAAFAASADKLLETHRVITDLLDQVNAIETFAASKSSEENRPDFDRLKETLERMKEATKDPNAASGPVEEATAKDEKTSDAPGGKGVLLPIGAISSRAEAEAALAAVCQYFRRCEPASPVPFLIERARRLLKLDFMESLRELAPESVEKFHPLFGTKEPKKPEDRA